MGVILLPQKHLTQPQYAAELDPLHWAFKDIVFAFSAGRGFADGKHPKLAGTLTTFTTFAPGAKGKYLQNTVPGNNAFFSNHADHDTLGGVTILGLVQPSSVSGQMTVVSKDTGGGGTNTPLGLLLDSGAVSLNRANAGFRVWKGVATLAAGQLAVVAATQGANIGTAPKFYINGEFDTGTPVNLFSGAGTGAPIATSEGIKLTANTSFANRFLGGIYGALVLNKEYSAEQVAELSRNLWAIWKAEPRRIYVTSAAGVTLTGAASTQANTASTAGITQAHAIAAAASAQGNASSSAAVTQDHALAGGAASQANTSSSPAITQDHVLTAGGSTQGNAASTGTITQGAQFVADVCTQANSASTGAITQAHALTAANGSQANTSSSAAVSQDHALAAAGSTQANVAASGAITQGTVHDLTAANSSQANTGAAGAITQAHVLVCAPSVQDSIAAASAIVQTHLLVAASGTQANACSTGAIEQISGVPPVDGPAGSGPRLRTVHGRRPSMRNTSRPRQLR